MYGEILPPKAARNQGLSGASLPHLRLDPNRIHEVQEHLPVPRHVGHHRKMQVHPEPVADEMPGEVPLLYRSPRQLRHLKFLGELEQREPVALKVVQQLRGGQLGTPVPPVGVAARLGGGARAGGFDAEGDVEARRAMAEQVVVRPAVRAVPLSERENGT